MKRRTPVVGAVLLALAVGILVPGCASNGPPPRGELPPTTQPSPAAQQADASTRFAEGVNYARRGATDKAISVFQDLTEDYPDLPGPYNNLAVLYASRGRYEEARQVLQKAIELQPGLDTAHENLGDIHVKLAVSAYQRASELREGNRRARSKVEALKLLLHPGVRREETVPLRAASDSQDTPRPTAGSRETTPSAARASKGAVQASVCYTLGPIADRAKLKQLTDWLRRQGLPGTTRQTQTETGAFYKVYLPPLASSDEAKQEVERLEAMGVRDLSVIWQGVLQNGISLGAYRQEASVKRRLSQLRDLDLAPEVEVVKKRQAIYWLDLEPVTGEHAWTKQFRQTFPGLILKTRVCERK